MHPNRLPALALLILFMCTGCYDFMKIMKREREAYWKNHPDGARFAPWKNDSIHYVTSGNRDSTAVLMIHGSPGSWDANAHLLNDSLLQQHFYLISIDRPGFGRSLAGKSDPSLASQADAVRAVLEKEAITTPVILLGHSWGGPVIVRFAADFPGQTRGLVNVAGSMDPALEKHKWYNYVARWKWVQRITDPAMRVSNEELWTAREELTLMIPVWKDLQVPLVTVQGMKDNLVPAKNADFIEKHAPAGILKTHRIPKEGHFVLWNRQDLMRQAIFEAAGKPLPR